MSDAPEAGNERPTRRELLRRGAGAVVAAGIAAGGGYLLRDSKGERGRGDAARQVRTLKNYLGEVDLPASSPRISVAIGGRERIERMVRAAVGALDPGRGIRRFVAPGDVVLVKPNVGFDRPPALGATTLPEVVRAVIRLCREAGASEVLITDNPIESPSTCFARSGIQRVADEEGARVVLPRAWRFETLVLRERGPRADADEAIGRWPILYEPLTQATKLIGVAPVKDHNLARASMGLKNWFGLLGGPRNRLHQAIDAAISDLALAFSPTLVIADATRVMMRNGPTGGRLSDVRPGGLLGQPAVVASVDPVACDAWCCDELLGREASRLGYLALAEQKIRSRVERGERRFCESDWRTYAGRGLILTQHV
jgi:uncharacterized protein (DUF362 family)